MLCSTSLGHIDLQSLWMCIYMKTSGPQTWQPMHISLPLEGIISGQKASLEAVVLCSKKEFGYLHPRTLWGQKSEKKKELQCVQHFENEWRVPTGCNILTQGGQNQRAWKHSGTLKYQAIMSSCRWMSKRHLQVAETEEPPCSLTSHDSPWASPWMPATRCSPLVAAWYLMYSRSDWCRLSIVFPKPSDKVPANWNEYKTGGNKF